ncbi:MAG: hypothetical protein ACREXR_19820 [Gammaproteobacteria bacterium]
MNYAKIKAYAKERGCRVDDLLALARANDPFYCGQPGHVALAKWFSSLWERFHFPQGVHLRRIHYVLVSQDPLIPDACGAPYANTERCWDLLGKASKAARYLDLVPIDAFPDKRNPEPEIYEHGKLPQTDFRGFVVEGGYLFRRIQPAGRRRETAFDLG